MVKYNFADADMFHDFGHGSDNNFQSKLNLLVDTQIGYTIPTKDGNSDDIKNLLDMINNNDTQNQYPVRSGSFKGIQDRMMDGEKQSTSQLRGLGRDALTQLFQEFGGCSVQPDHGAAKDLIDNKKYQNQNSNDNLIISTPATVFDNGYIRIFEILVFEQLEQYRIYNYLFIK